MYEMYHDLIIKHREKRVSGLKTAENLGRFFRCSNSATTCDCVNHFPRIFLLIYYQCYFLSVCNIPCANNLHVHCCSITRRFLNFFIYGIFFLLHWLPLRTIQSGSFPYVCVSRIVGPSMSWRNESLNLYVGLDVEK